MIHEHLAIKGCEGVYDPLEDSSLLAEAVENIAFGKVLDLGTGSGIQGIVAAKKGCDVTFADIDPEAVECAKMNAKLNGVFGKFIVSDMFDNIEEKFNTIVFNPPYLESIGEDEEELALSGGRKGRTLIDRFIDSYRGHLLDNHAVLLVESDINCYEKDVIRLGAKIVAQRKFFFEELVVLRFE